MNINIWTVIVLCFGSVTGFCTESEKQDPYAFPPEIRDAFVKAYFAAPNVTDQNQVLSGLDEFQVVISVDPEFEEIISSKAIKDRVELQLRRNGVKVVPLYDKQINISVRGLSTKGIPDFMDIRIVLLEMVIIPRGKAFISTPVTTWNDGTLCRTAHDQTRGKLEQVLDDLTNSFANAYAAANPKQVLPAQVKE